jgi:iron complex outermembrane receptor protein
MNPLNRSLDNLIARPARTPLAAALQLAMLGAAFAAASAGAQVPPAGSPPSATAEPAKEEPAKPAAPVTSTLPTVSVKGRAEESATGPVQGYVAKRSATATKTDTPLIETPQSISVITADRVEAIGASTLREAMGYTPGINISPWGTDSRYDNWIHLRGFDAYKPGFNLDGLPLRNADTWGVYQTDNYGAERIEVLRGPASVLYGQGSPGGTVNVVSKRPQAEAQREIRLQVSDPQRVQLMSDFTGPAVDDASVLYRVTTLVRDGKTFDGLVPDERVYIAPAVTLNLSPDTTFTVLSHLLSFNTSTHGGAPMEGTLLPNPNGPISPDVYPGEPGSDRFDHQQWMAGYQLEHRFSGDMTLRHAARYGEVTLDYQQVSWSGTFSEDLDGMRLADRNVFASRENNTTFVTDTHLQVAIGQGQVRHTLLAGLDHQRSRFDVLAFWGGAPALDLYAPVYGADIVLPGAPFMNSDIVMEQTGLYLQDQMRIGERLSVTLGARYDNATTNASDRSSGASLDVKDNEVTSRAGLVYQLEGGWAPYLGYSESFSPSTSLNSATGKPFEPETGRQYEAGLRWQPDDVPASVSVAVFDLVRRNYVTNDVNFVAFQTGEVQVRGLEVEAALQPRSGMNVVAAYTLTPRAIVTESINPAEVGKQLNPVPRHAAAVWADYRFAQGFKAGLGLRYSGSHRGTGESAPVPLPSYTVVDALLARDIGDWNVALNVRNLADKVYLTNCSGTSCYFGDDRRATVTATYRW